MNALQAFKDSVAKLTAIDRNRILFDAGIIDENGELMEHYKSPEESIEIVDANSWNSEEQALNHLRMFHEYTFETYPGKFIDLNIDCVISPREESAVDYLFYNYGWGFRQSWY